MKNREPFENYSPITRCLLKPEGALAVWTAIWIPHILYWLYWRISEERQLERKYKSYQEYKRETWF